MKNDPEPQLPSVYTEMSRDNEIESEKLDPKLSSGLFGQSLKM